MAQLQTFIFKNLPVRGAIVRLSSQWQQMLLRRTSGEGETQAFPAAVNHLLGQMTASTLLLQSLLRFDGNVLLQIMGDGFVKVAVSEVKSDFRFRATATIKGAAENDSLELSNMINHAGHGRCAIILDPKNKQQGQQIYQGIVALSDDLGLPFKNLSQVLEHHMNHSQQLDTTVVLAANSQVAAGILIQRLPLKGAANLAATQTHSEEIHAQDTLGKNEDYNRLALLTKSLKEEELLTLSIDEILHRLYWQEDIELSIPVIEIPLTENNTDFTAGKANAPLPTHFVDDGLDPNKYKPLQPRFACSCSRPNVAQMIISLGEKEALDILQSENKLAVTCEFCGATYAFDSVDVAQLFASNNTNIAAPKQAI